MTVALVLTKTRMMITENSLKMLYYNTHTVLGQRTFTLQKCTVRSETNCKNQIVVKNLRILAQLLHLSESHLLRLYFDVFQPSVFFVFFPVRRNKLSSVNTTEPKAGGESEKAQDWEQATEPFCEEE